MKKQMVIFWDDGVMMCREFVEEPEKVIVKNESGLQINKGSGKKWAHYYHNLEAARQAALPVADEGSKDKVEHLINDKFHPYVGGNIDQTKEYVIEAEMKEKVICQSKLDGSLECTTGCDYSDNADWKPCNKVLVLVEFNKL